MMSLVPQDVSGPPSQTLSVDSLEHLKAGFPDSVHGMESIDSDSNTDSQCNNEPGTTCPSTRPRTPETLPSSIGSPILQPTEAEGLETNCDRAILEEISLGSIQLHSLETKARDLAHAVKLRRQAFESIHGLNSIRDIPHQDFAYDSVFGRCIENTIGFVPIPLGLAGPLTVDGLSCFIPMATTEGTLVASTSRGSKALSMSGGVFTALLDEGMTRAPLITFKSLTAAVAAKRFLDSPSGFDVVREAFNATTCYGSLTSLSVWLVASKMFIRFKANTGEAMGMNMISKGVDAVLQRLGELELFQEGRCETLSSNLCSDKKSAAINWIAGRGRSMVGEAVVKGDAVRRVLKTTPAALARLNLNKNFVGGALAGATGGAQNANAANIVAAIFAATGQDLAQVMESSNCMVVMEQTEMDDLRVSMSMPSIEVATVGGGTHLQAQSGALHLLNAPQHAYGAGINATRLASIILAAVMASELSLCSALAAGHLMDAHLRLNRKKT